MVTLFLETPSLLSLGHHQTYPTAGMAIHKVRQAAPASDIQRTRQVSEREQVERERERERERELSLFELRLTASRPAIGSSGSAGIRNSVTAVGVLIGVLGRVASASGGGDGRLLVS